MGKIAYLFPGQGQGSIRVGMGYDVWQHSPKARRIFGQADLILGRSLSHLCFFGPEEELLKTANAQPASLVVNLAYAAAISELDEDFEFHPKKKQPDFLAGHSVGYLATLVYSGAVSFEQGLKIAQKRGELTSKACQENPGKMAALINPNVAEIEKLCHVFEVEIANYNSETQIVLSGRSESLDTFLKIIQERNLARKIIPLNIEGAFHSKLMESVKEPFREFLEPISFSDPKIPIIGNSDAQLITRKKEAKAELVVQLSSPVLWQQSMEVLNKLGVTTFLEIGHGEVLTNNLRRSRMIGLAGAAAIVSVSAALATYLVLRRKKKNSD